MWLQHQWPVAWGRGGLPKPQFPLSSNADKYGPCFLGLRQRNEPRCREPGARYALGVYQRPSGRRSQSGHRPCPWTPCGRAQRKHALSGPGFLGRRRLCAVRCGGRSEGEARVTARGRGAGRGPATCASHARSTLKLAGGEEGATVWSLECLGLCSPYFCGPRGGGRYRRLTFIERLLCTPHFMSCFLQLHAAGTHSPGAGDTEAAFAARSFGGASKRPPATAAVYRSLCTS